MNPSDSLTFRLLATAPHAPEKPGFSGNINAGMDFKTTIASADVIVRAFQWTNTNGATSVTFRFNPKTGAVDSLSTGTVFPSPDKDIEGEDGGASSLGLVVAMGLQAVGDTNTVLAKGYAAYPASPDSLLRLPGHNGAALAFFGEDAFGYTTFNLIEITASCGGATTNGLYVFFVFKK